MEEGIEEEIQFEKCELELGNKSGKITQAANAFLNKLQRGQQRGNLCWLCQTLVFTYWYFCFYWYLHLH